MPCGSASCARRMRGRASRSAIWRRCAGASAAVLTAADVPANGYGIYPDIKDQPVLADGEVRYRGEAVWRWSATAPRCSRIRDERGADRLDARAAARRHRRRDRARCAAGAGRQAEQSAARGRGASAATPPTAFAACAAVAEGVFETAFVEHAYIEPEAGWAQRVGDRIEIHVCDPDALHGPRRGRATCMRLRPEAVRIVPTACGGGFGGKLDLSVQPLVGAGGLEARSAGRAASTRGPKAWRPRTKRHPARIAARSSAAMPRASSLACDVDGDLRHRRLCLVGPDRRQSRAGACHGPLRRAQRAHLGRGLLHQRPARRRLPRLRRAAGRDRPRGDDGRAGRPARHRPAGVPPSQRAARRRHDGDAARCSTHSAGLAAMPRGAAAALAEGAGRGRRLQRARAAPGGAASASAACGTASATPRCPTPRRMRVGAGAGRHADALQRRGRYRPGLQHHHDPDRRRCAGPAGRRSSRWSRAIPISPPMPARPRPRARPSSPAGRPSAPAATCASRSCGWPMPAPDATLSLDGATLTVRDGGEVRALDLGRASAPLMGEGTLRSADHAARCRRPGRALCDLCLRRPDRRRSRSISSSAR